MSNLKQNILSGVFAGANVKAVISTPEDEKEADHRRKMELGMLIGVGAILIVLVIFSLCLLTFSCDERKCQLASSILSSILGACLGLFAGSKLIRDK